MCIIMVIYWKIVFFLAMLLALFTDYFAVHTVYFTLNKYALKILVSGTTDNSQL